MENERKRLKFEIFLERYFTNFHRILLTNLLFAVPSAIIFTAMYFLNIALFKAISIPFFLIAIIPLYPFYAGVVLVCRNIARGDAHVTVVKNYFTAVKDNFPVFLLHGLAICLATVLSYFSISFYISFLGQSWIFYALFFFCLIIILLVFYTSFYLPLISVTYDISLPYVYKNSFLMSFGEFKNNFFATLALAVIFAICFTVTAFSGSVPVLIVFLCALWALILPATYTFANIFFIYDGMVSIISSKDEISRELNAAIDAKMKEHRASIVSDVEEEDFSDIDISSLRDTDDYIYHNGRMIKQSAILRQLKERESNRSGEDQNG